MSEFVFELTKGLLPFFSFVILMYIAYFLFIKIKNHIQNKVNQKNVYEEKNYGACPICGERLVLKKGRYGKFIGCNNYPKCKYTIDYKKSYNNRS